MPGNEECMYMYTSLVYISENRLIKNGIISSVCICCVCICMFWSSGYSKEMQPMGNAFISKLLKKKC